MTYRTNNCLNAASELVECPLNVRVGQLADLLLPFPLIESNLTKVGGYIKAEIDTGRLPELLLHVVVNLFATDLNALEFICKLQHVALEINILH